MRNRFSRQAKYISNGLSVIIRLMEPSNRYKILIISIILAFVPLLIRVGTAADQKVVPSTMHRKFDPVQVPGELLSALHGKPTDSLRLFSYRNGAMAQMVYQIDERLANGTYIFELGVIKNPEKADHILHPQTLLVFRIADTGDRAPQELWPSRDGVEIELNDPTDGGKSWCYLLCFADKAPARIKQNTVSLEHWDPWKKSDLPFVVKGFSYIIEGMVNKIGNHYYKTALNKNFKVPPTAGGTGVNIIDGLRLRAFVDLFFGKSKIHIDETGLIGGIDAITQGYIRGYGLQWLTAALPMNIEGPRLYNDVFTYDTMVVAPMRVHIPIDPRHIITRAGIEYGYDLNEAAYGMKYYSPNCMEGVTIDGKNTDKKKAIPTKWAPWQIYTGPQGSLILRVSIAKELLDQFKPRTDFIDDRSQAFPPETIPGSIGYARTTVDITSLRPGMYNARIEWYFPPNFYKQGGYDKDELKQYFNILDAPIVIKAGGRSAKNEALNPPSLYPKR